MKGRILTNSWRHPGTTSTCPQRVGIGGSKEGRHMSIHTICVQAIVPETICVALCRQHASQRALLKYPIAQITMTYCGRDGKVVDARSSRWRRSFSASWGAAFIRYDYTLSYIMMLDLLGGGNHFQHHGVLLSSGMITLCRTS